MAESHYPCVETRHDWLNASGKGNPKVDQPPTVEER
jgi:hypothetical protein